MYILFTLVLLVSASSVFSAPLENRSVPTGQVITTCTTPNTIALTFDDGPASYSNQLLDILSEYGAHATFFVTGDAAKSFPDIIRRARREGHQIGSHTYAHPSLPSLPNDEVVRELTRLENTLQPIMGDIPTYTRPPYFEVNEQVLQTMHDLGYKVIQASVDTKDYENKDPTKIDLSYERFLTELNAGGRIVLAHDIHEQTVATLTRKMLNEIKARNLKITTVGDCLGEPQGAWYKQNR